MTLASATDGAEPFAGRPGSLAKTSDLAYTSVLTVFQTLEKNGHVEHEREGKAYRNEPTVSREETGREALEYVTRRLFEDSPEALMTSLGGVADGRVR